MIESVGQLLRVASNDPFSLATLNSLKRASRLKSPTRRHAATPNAKRQTLRWHATCSSVAREVFIRTGVLHVQMPRS